MFSVYLWFMTIYGVSEIDFKSLVNPSDKALDKIKNYVKAFDPLMSHIFKQGYPSIDEAFYMVNRIKSILTFEIDIDDGIVKTIDRSNFLVMGSQYSEGNMNMINFFVDKGILGVYPKGYFLSKKGTGKNDGKYNAISGDNPFVYEQRDKLIIVHLSSENLIKKREHTFFVYEKKLTIDQMLPF